MNRIHFAMPIRLTIRILWFAMMLAILQSTALSQPVLIINPNGDGGFELGETFSANGWELVNGSQQNSWQVDGVVPGRSGDRAAYISSDAGITWGYNTEASSVVHFYKDISFPSNKPVIHLSFMYNGIAEGDADRLRVYLVSTTTDVSAGTELTTGRIGHANYNGVEVFTNVVIRIPGSAAGTTQRLVFSWRNDGARGNQPPIAVDRIKLTASGIEPCKRWYLIKSEFPSDTSNADSAFLPNLNAAIAELNDCQLGEDGATIIIDRDTLREMPLALTATGTESAPIMIEGAPGKTPVLSSHLPYGQDAGAIALKGTDHLTLKNFTIECRSIEPDPNSRRSGIFLGSKGPEDGAQHNTFINITILMNGLGTAIVSVADEAATGVSGPNSHNRFEAVIARLPILGALFRGNPSNPDVDNWITQSEFHEIRNDEGSAFGLQLFNQDGPVVMGCTLFSIIARFGAVGIAVDRSALGEAGTVHLGNNSITNLSSEQGVTSAIRISGSGLGTVDISGTRIRDLSNTEGSVYAIHTTDAGDLSLVQTSIGQLTAPNVAGIKIDNSTSPSRSFTSIRDYELTSAIATSSLVGFRMKGSLSRADSLTMNLVTLDSLRANMIIGGVTLEDLGYGSVYSVNSSYCFGDSEAVGLKINNVRTVDVKDYHIADYHVSAGHATGIFTTNINHTQIEGVMMSRMTAPQGTFTGFHIAGDLAGGIGSFRDFSLQEIAADLIIGVGLARLAYDGSMGLFRFADWIAGVKIAGISLETGGSWRLANSIMRNMRTQSGSVTGIYASSVRNLQLDDVALHEFSAPSGSVTGVDIAGNGIDHAAILKTMGFYGMNSLLEGGAVNGRGLSQFLLDNILINDHSSKNGPVFGVKASEIPDLLITNAAGMGITSENGAATGLQISNAGMANVVNIQVGDINGRARSVGIEVNETQSVNIHGAKVEDVKTTATSTPSQAIGVSASGDKVEIQASSITDVLATSASGALSKGVEIKAKLKRIRDNTIDMPVDLFSEDLVSFNPLILGLVALGLQNSGVPLSPATADTLEMEHNSIGIWTTLSSANSACLWLRTSNAVSSIRNNIFANFGGPQAGVSKHYAVLADSGHSLPGSIMDHNVLHVANEPNGFIGRIGTTDFKSLADWRAATGQDANSFSHDPQFISPTDLHINPSVPSPVSNNGIPIPGMTTDIDGDPRDPSTPDIGADEGDFTSLFANDVQALRLINPRVGEAKPVNAPMTPSATFYNAGLNDQSDVAVSILIVGPIPSRPVVYSDSTRISLVAGDYPDTVFFKELSISNPGKYTVIVRTDLPDDQNRANDEVSVILEISGPVEAGTYNVGPGQPPPYNTLSGAVERLNVLGIDGPVQLCLEPGTYSQGEQFPITIKSIAGSSPTNTITITPCSGGLGSLAVDWEGEVQEEGAGVTISGSSATSIIKFEDASNVILDGSFNGGTDRNLTIRNTNSAAGTGGIWLASSGSGRGCKNIVVKNTRISCGVNQSTSSSTSIGIGIGASVLNTLTFSDGFGNDGNTIMNNVITRARFGIYLRGAPSSLNENNTIVNNIIGPTSFGSEQIGMAGIVVQNQNNVTVSQNVVRFVGGGITQTISGADRVGIGLGTNSWPAGQSTVSNSRVTRNLIHDIVEERTNAAVGIVVGALGPGGGPSTNVIANNMISNIRANGTTTNQALGIGLGTGNTDKVVFNTISMTGDMDPVGTTSATHSAAGIRIASPANLTIKNNIVSVDVSSNTSTLSHYAILAPTNYFWGGGSSNFNDYDVNPSNPQMVLGGIGSATPYTDVATIESWRTQFVQRQDSHSVAVKAHFLSSSNLHLTEPSVGDPSFRGKPISGITDDYDGDPRDASNPFIGADEAVGGFPSVTLTSFEAEFDPQALDVVLSWSTFGEVRNAGFFVERRKDTDTEFTDLPGNFVPGQGTTSSPANYSFRDTTITENGVYHYRLRQVDSASVATYLDTVNIRVTVTGVVETTPHTYFLSQNHPNPFNPVTIIRFGTRDAGSVTLKVYDILGREVAVLVNEKLPAGVYTRTWDASDVPSGVYWYRLTASSAGVLENQFSQVRKLLLVR